MTPESKPQGSEQPKCWACNNERLTIISENPTWYRCPHCREEFQWPTPDAPLGPLTGSPLPNPSADEEVETPLVDAAFAEYPVMDTQRGGDAITIQAAREIESELRKQISECQHTLYDERQQHNADREEWKAESMRLLKETEQLTVSLSTRESELATAQKKADAEMERVKACEHIAEGDEGWEALANLCPSTAAVTALRYQLQTAMEETIKKLIDVKVLLSGEPKLPIHAIDIINDLMTRLSSSRSTGRKDNAL